MFIGHGCPRFKAKVNRGCPRLQAKVNGGCPRFQAKVNGGITPEGKVVVKSKIEHDLSFMVPGIS